MIRNLERFGSKKEEPEEIEPEKEQEEGEGEEEKLFEDDFKWAKETRLPKEVKDGISYFLLEGHESGKKRAEEYEANAEKRHTNVDDAVYERTAAHTKYMYFSEALTGLSEGNYDSVIEVLERFKSKEEEKLEEYRGAWNISRLENEWENLSESKRNEINEKIEEFDKKIGNLKRKRLNWAEQLRQFKEEPEKKPKEDLENLQEELEKAREETEEAYDEGEETKKAEE